MYYIGKKRINIKKKRITVLFFFFLLPFFVVVCAAEILGYIDTVWVILQAIKKVRNQVQVDSIDALLIVLLVIYIFLDY